MASRNLFLIPSSGTGDYVSLQSARRAQLILVNNAVGSITYTIRAQQALTTAGYILTTRVIDGTRQTMCVVDIPTPLPAGISVSATGAWNGLIIVED